MQNLREKLLKAGLVSEKQVEQAERQKPQPPPRPARPAAPARAAPLSEEERQRQEAFAARAAEQSEERRREAAKRTEARMQSERALKLRQLVAEHRLRDALVPSPAAGEPAASVDFHYVRRNGRIGRLLVAPATAQLLESGAAAVVEDPGQPEPAVVPQAVAQTMFGIDPKSIRFWSGPSKPIGFEDSDPGN